MGTFTPIAMRCTQEQFDAVKPKLRGLSIHEVDFFNSISNSYLTNNLVGNNYVVSNISQHCKRDYNREVHEEWDEEIFLKACSIKTETLQEKAIRLENELNEVKQQIEDSKIKIGDWVMLLQTKNVFKIGLDNNVSLEYVSNNNTYSKKITNKELIKLLEQEIK